jgi:hypothetical protein
MQMKERYGVRTGRSTPLPTPTNAPGCASAFPQKPHPAGLALWGPSRSPDSWKNNGHETYGDEYIFCIWMRESCSLSAVEKYEVLSIKERIVNAHCY